MKAEVTAKQIDIDITLYAFIERERIDRGQALKMLCCYV